MRKRVPALPYLSGVGEGAGTGCEQMGPCLYGTGDRSRPCVQLRILLNPGVGLGVFQSESQKVSSVGTVQSPPQNHGPPWAWSSDGPSAETAGLVSAAVTEPTALPGATSQAAGAGKELIGASLWRGGVEAGAAYPVRVPGQKDKKYWPMDAAIGGSIAGFLAD